MSEDSKTSDMTLQGLGEMFEGDSADTCGGKFPLASMGGRADPSSVRRRGARTPIGASGNYYKANNDLRRKLKLKHFWACLDIDHFVIIEYMKAFSI